MDITNKTLAVMLVAAIVVSIGGTFISLTRLGDASTIGYNTYNASGEVSLTIQSSLSITTTDSDTINFGSCNLGEGSAGITINSDVSGLGSNTGADCSGAGSGFIATPIAVRNDGNLHANVSFNVSKVGTGNGGDFLNTGSTDSSIGYKLLNQGLVGSAGCAGILGNGVDNTSMASYVVFQNTSELNACSNLTAGSANTFLTHFQIVIPTAAASGDNVTVTYFATESGI
jgi:hypothetical protein